MFDRRKRSLHSFATSRGLAWRTQGLCGLVHVLAGALFFVLLSGTPITPAHAQGQLPAPSADQLEILRNLPPEQRDALIEQILSGQRGGVDRRDRQLSFPDTVRRRGREDNEELARELGLEADPRLRAEDTLLLLLEIREFKGPDPVSAPMPVPGQMSVGQQAQQAQQAQHAQQQLQAAGPRERIVRTEEEIDRLEQLRDRIRHGNPYRLDRFGQLEVSELGRIELAGLTVGQAQRRLSVEKALADFVVEVVLLPLERVGEEGLKPFGYDLFAGTPTTFAPATDVPVPADYVVGPGDRLEVQLFGNTNKTYSLVVGRDGQINFPELGPIAVSGQTFSQVERALEKRVETQMIGVRASVTMGETRSIRVFVLGEAEVPGSYTVSGLSTITNALFVSGGVKEIGSLRNIQLKRNGQLVRELDLYDLLLRGDTSDDARLLPGDVIFIPAVQTVVSVTGEVRRPAIYELKDETTVAQVIELAGGLTAEADPALANVERINDHRQRVTLNVNLESPSDRSMRLATGDLLRVPPIRTALENSVLLQGHVYRPGLFQYREGMRLTDVLRSLDELKPHADTHYVLIRRESPADKLISVHSADLARALTEPGSDDNVPLAARDRITVFDLSTNRDRIVQPLLDEVRMQSRLGRPNPVVGVGGRVNVPGQYPLEPGMRVSDLIRAGGRLEDAAFGGHAELARYTVIGGEGRHTELIEIDLAAVLRGDPTADVLLQAYDFLNVKELPYWREQEEVEILGEVRFPGRYPVQRGETLRSVLMRAGGLTDLAFTEGAVFLRKDLQEREQQQIETLATRLQSDIAVLALQASQLDSNAMQALSVGQSLLGELRATEAVGRLVLDLDAVIASAPNSTTDLVLRDGDRLLIPKVSQEVTVLGEVLTNTSHLWQPDLNREDYIGLSGGTNQKADRGRIYVVRANGSVVAGGSGWFSRSGTEIRPGDSIVVPLDAERMRPLPLWAAVTQIVYHLAIAAAAVNSF